MQEYFINFFLWWYLVKVKAAFFNAIKNLVFYMNLTLALPMAQNLFVPMFRDKSSGGKALSLFIRFWWVGFGTIASIAISLPYFVFALFLLILPVLPIIQIILFIV